MVLRDTASVHDFISCELALEPIPATVRLNRRL
jgi:hypothetical protein